MMESANLWEGDDLACFGALDRPGDRTETSECESGVNCD